MDPIESERTLARIASLRVCFPMMEEKPMYSVNPVTPWGRGETLKFQLGHREVNSVSFPWPLSPPAGRPDEGVYFTTISIRMGEASRRIDVLERELGCLFPGGLASGWWIPPKETHHRHLLRIMVDTDTRIEMRAFLGGRMTKEDVSVVTKGCHARVDLELVGVKRLEEGGAYTWRPQFRAVRICVLEGIGVYARAGIPVHVAHIDEPDNVSALDYRGGGEK